jgi:hypothetical protein
MQGTRAVHRRYIPLHQRRAKMHGYTSSRSTSHACREVSRKCQIGRDTVPLAKTNESIDRGVASVETTGGHVRGCAVCTARTCMYMCAGLRARDNVASSAGAGGPPTSDNAYPGARTLLLVRRSIFLSCGDPIPLQSEIDLPDRQSYQLACT